MTERNKENSKEGSKPSNINPSQDADNEEKDDESSEEDEKAKSLKSGFKFSK